jgi:hypothetical protein
MMDRDTWLALSRGTTELETALIDLSHYMDDETLTPAQRRTVSSATAKMADATMQMTRMLKKAKP